MAPAYNSPTPWGPAQHVIPVADGIWQVDTAGRGGIKLDAKRNRKVPKGARLQSGWYGEGCEWSIAVLSNPDAFTEEALGFARDILRGWCSDAAPLFGLTV